MTMNITLQEKTCRRRPKTDPLISTSNIESTITLIASNLPLNIALHERKHAEKTDPRQVPNNHEICHANMNIPYWKHKNPNCKSKEPGDIVAAQLKVPDNHAQQEHLSSRNSKQESQVILMQHPCKRCSTCKSRSIYYAFETMHQFKDSPHAPQCVRRQHKIN